MGGHAVPPHSDLRKFDCKHQIIAVNAIRASAVSYTTYTDTDYTDIPTVILATSRPPRTL